MCVFVFFWRDGKWPSLHSQRGPWSTKKREQMICRFVILESFLRKSGSSVLSMSLSNMIWHTLYQFNLCYSYLQGLHVLTCSGCITRNSICVVSWFPQLFVHPCAFFFALAHCLLGTLSQSSASSSVSLSNQSTFVKSSNIDGLSP